MDGKVNFTLVGVFLVVFILSLISFSLWLGKYGMETVQNDQYKIYLKESVAGLNVESSVKYKGVNVGVVKDIVIDPNNSEQIKIVVDILHGTPIKEDTFAVLESQGITGLKFINLTGGTKNSPLIKRDSSNIPQIKSKLSFFGSLEGSASDITTKVNLLLNKLNKVLDEKNMDRISSILENSKELTGNLNEIIVKLDSKSYETLTGIDEFTKKFSHTLNKFDNLIENDLKNTMVKVSAASDSTHKAFNGFSQQIQSGQMDIKDIADHSLKKFDLLMAELEKTMYNAQKTLDKLQDSPSDLIFKSRKIEYGPGEKDE